MIAQANHIIDCFLADILLQIRCQRINATSEHEILPNQNTVFITKIVEEVFFIDTASPYTKHVHVGIDRIHNCRFILFGGNTWQEVILGNIVSTFHEYRYTVQFEVERMAVFVRFIYDTDTADTDVCSIAVGNLIIHADSCSERIQVSFT